MSGSTTLYQFENAAYARTGQPELFDDTIAIISDISKSALPDRKYGYEVFDTATATLWELGDSTIRRTMAIGSIASGSWLRSFQHSRRDMLYFSQPAHLENSARETDDSELAIASLVAVGAEFRSRVGFVPSSFAPWAVRLSKNTDEPQRQRIAHSLESLRFSNHHIDSEDMGDPHGVSTFLHDESLPLSLRQQLLDLAFADAQSTDYKPWAWQAQLNVTLHGLAQDTDNPLRFDARKRLELPESDVEYQTLLDQQAAVAARLHDKQRSWEKAKVNAQKEAVRAMVGAALLKLT